VSHLSSTKILEERRIGNRGLWEIPLAEYNLTRGGQQGKLEGAFGGVCEGGRKTNKRAAALLQVTGDPTRAAVMNVETGASAMGEVGDKVFDSKPEEKGRYGRHWRTV